ncbi:MAG: hypothetical protein R3E10_01770 [Gemmatimonadota bacterium]
MTPAEDAATLEDECRILCLALTGEPATPVLIEKYRLGHGHPSFQRPWTALDQALLGTARRGPGWARVADAYAALFDRRGLLRRKLVLLFALAETLPPHHRVFEQAPLGRLPAALTLVGAGVAALFRLSVGVVRFGPSHLRSRATTP